MMYIIKSVPRLMFFIFLTQETLYLLNVNIVLEFSESVYDAYVTWQSWSVHVLFDLST